MFSKALSLALVYVLTIFNLLFITLPLSAAFIPFLLSNKDFVVDENLAQKIVILLFLIIFFISFFMLIYIFLDFLFGFSLKSSLKNCKNFRSVKYCEFLEEIFAQVKEKFGEKHVELYIKDSDEINAYAVSSMNRKAIILTKGIIVHYMELSEDGEEFLLALRSIMAHEMSHLINKDFLPGFLVIANQKATNFVSAILEKIFNMFAYVLSFIPYGGRYSVLLMISCYNFINFMLTFFNRVFVRNIYEFIKKFISRATEFRCDKQAAQAFGGYNMALALSFLGKSGYFTFFSTHPSTKRRVKKVQYIVANTSIIRQSFSSLFANYLAFLILVTICLFFAKKSHVDLVVRYLISVY